MPSQLLTVRSLICIAQQGPHVLEFQVHRLLSLKLQWLRLRRLCRRPPVRWFQPPLRCLCQLHSLSLRLVQLCHRTLRLKLARFTHLPGSSGISVVGSCLTSNGRSTSTSTRTNIKLSVRELSATPVSSGALDGSICLFIVKSSSSTPVACYNSSISASQCFLSYSTNTTSSHSRYAIFITSNYPVAGPGSILPASFAPSYLSFTSASVFPAANFPPFVVGPGIPPVAPKIVAVIVSGIY